MKLIEVPEKSGKSLHFAHWLFLPPVPENKPSKTQAGMEAESPSLQVLTPVTVSAHPEAGRPYLLSSGDNSGGSVSTAHPEGGRPRPDLPAAHASLGWSSSGYSGWLHLLLLSLEPLLPENPSPGELSHRLLQEAPSDLDPLVMTAVHFGAFGTSLKHPFEPVTFFFLVVVKKQNTYHEICPLNKVLRVQSSILNYHCRVIEQLSRTFSSCMTLCTH